MMKRHVLPIVVLVALSLLAVRPLFTPGFFPMHDDAQVGRVVSMGRALRNGQFPVRWVSDLGYGYGYPIFNFYGPLPYYVGGILYALGFWGITATKVMMGLGVILSGITMYMATGSLVSAIFYLYMPYHAVQIYVRGAVGEYWALVFLPLIFLGIRKGSSTIGGIGLAGTILSHTLLGFTTTVFYFAYLLIGWIRTKRLVPGIIVVGLGMSAFFWLPALIEMRYTNVASQVSPSANFTDHFVCLSQLWNSPWGYGGSSLGCADGLSFKLGKGHIIAGLAGMIFSPKWPIFAFVAISIFFLLPESHFLWSIIPGFVYLQYPWRFLAFAGAGLSVLSGGILVPGRNKIIRGLIATVTITSVLLLEGKRFVPQFTYAKDNADFETLQELRWHVSKISDEYLPKDVDRPTQNSSIAGLAIIPSGTLEVGTDIDRETYKKFALLSKVDQRITIARAYFPGWHYFVNGKETLEYLYRGLPVLAIPEGESVVEMRFTNTGIRTIANLLSVATIFYLLYSYGKKTYA